jgi:hypothetical protein
MLTSDGSLSQEGVLRVRNAVLARAYPQPDLLARLTESTDTPVKNLGNALMMAAPAIASMRDGIDKGDLHPLDAGKDIAAAANKLAHLKEQGDTVEDYLNQKQMFGDDLSPLAKDFLSAFNTHNKKPKMLRQLVSTYAEMVEAYGSPKQGGLLKQAVPTKAEILAAALKKTAQEEPNEKSSLFKGEAAHSRRVDTPARGLEEKESGGTHEATARRVAGRKKPQKTVVARMRWRGLQINIEYPVGSLRPWKGGEITMQYAYGEFPDIAGRDGDPLDVFVGPNLDAAFVYIVTILKQPALIEEDEDKVFIGFRSEPDALAAFLLHYDDPRLMGRTRIEKTEEFVMEHQQQQIVILHKGMTTRRGHWSTYQGRMVWVSEHPLSYQEGRGEKNQEQGHLAPPAPDHASTDMPAPRPVVPVQRPSHEPPSFQGELFSTPSRSAPVEATANTGPAGESQQAHHKAMRQLQSLAKETKVKGKITHSKVQGYRWYHSYDKVHDLGHTPDEALNRMRDLSRRPTFHGVRIARVNNGRMHIFAA